MRLFFCLFIALVSTLASAQSDRAKFDWDSQQDYLDDMLGREPRKPEPITNDYIKGLQPYLRVKVGIFHYEYTPEDPFEVKGVQQELTGVKFLFESHYHFEVVDVPIPKTNSDHATSYVRDRVSGLYEGLSGPDSLVIIVYGGHGSTGGDWYINTYHGAVKVNWRSIDTNVIAPTGIDTFQIIDACRSEGFLPALGESYPPEWAGRGAFSVIAASTADGSAGSCANAFTKAVLFVLAPPPHMDPYHFTPSSLYNAIPRLDTRYAYLTGDASIIEATLRSWYGHRFFELGQANTNRSPRKIAPLCG